MKKKIFKNAAIITGGAGFLGIQHALAICEMNLCVVLIDLDFKKLKLAKKEILKLWPKAEILIYKCDICNEATLKKIQNNLKKNKIFVKVLINNAAINPKMKSILSGSSGSIESYNSKDLRKELDVNIVGSFLCIKIFGSLMAQKKQGSIINIASDAGLIAPDQSIYHPSENILKVKHFKPAGYSISKHGLIGLTKYIATYWGHKNVRCNALAIGAVKKKQTNFLLKNLKKRIPLQRLAEKFEYKKAIIFLASDASSYMTGEVMTLDGGRTSW